jgi:hypothetical protein
MPDHTSNVTAQVLAVLDREHVVVWGAGPNTEWTADDPAEQIHAALRAVETRTALDPATAKDGVKPLYLVLTARLLAAATATRESRDLLAGLADRGPAVDVHPVFAVSSGQYLNGAEFTAILRVLGDLNEGIDLGPDDIAQADESYVGGLFSLLRPPLDAGSVEALGPDYAPAPDAPQNPVAEAAREVLRAADGVWDDHVVRRWRTLLDREPRMIVFVDEAAQLLGGTPDAVNSKELMARLLMAARGDDTMWVFDPKDDGSPFQQWPPSRPSSVAARVQEDGDTVLADLHAELLRRGHTHLELIEVDDVATAHRMLGLDTAQPLHAMRVHFPGDRLVDAHEIEEAIRGRDQDEALANARWNWPLADRIDYLGHYYEVGDPVADVENPDRSGRIVSVLDGAAIQDGPRLFVRFADADQDEEVSRDRIRFTDPGSAQDTGGKQS